MKYPQNPKEGQWYTEIRPHTQQTGVYANVFSTVVIGIGIAGSNKKCDFKSVNLKVQDVEKELTDGIALAKKIVNILNGDDKPVVPETGTCAKCNGPCPEDDYLCRGCRS